MKNITQDEMYNALLNAYKKYGSEVDFNDSESLEKFSQLVCDELCKSESETGCCGGGCCKDEEM